MAEGTILSLKRNTLDNVNDSAGIWQYAGGDVEQNGQKVGIYISMARKLTKMDPAFNTSTYSLTLFFSGSIPSQNMTLQGVWDSTAAGGAIGSVSAISEGLEGADGAPFTIEGDQLLIKAIWSPPSA